MSPFSVLMSVYSGENPKILYRALISLYEQTLRPNEIVLVEDGDLNTDLYNTINKSKEFLNESLKVIKLDNNYGLGVALNTGLNYCSNSLISRMDSDDISYPDRFEKQINFLEENQDIDILGGYITEFYQDEDKVTGIRKVPLKHSDIIKRVRFRSPMNHVTVIFKKSVVQAVGGYRIPWPGRDHDLWLKLAHYGATFANIPDFLVKVRTGGDQLSRRGGWKFYRGELKLHYNFYQKGLISHYELTRNVFVRTGIRLLPRILLKQFYKINRKYFS